MIEFHLNRVKNAIEDAVRLIPPAWPLASSVAVNPFLGHTGERLAPLSERLSRITGASITMPRSWYLDRIKAGTITDGDLAAALGASPYAAKPANLAALKVTAAQPVETQKALPTVADLATEASGVQWPLLIADRIGAWAGSYFDEGQALWAAPRGRSAWGSWKAYAAHDLTPEIQGLDGFATRVLEAPDSSLDAIARAVASLKLSDGEVVSYFHQLLLSLSGWAQFARYRLWQAELAGGNDETLRDMLAIRIFWEDALHAHFAAEIEAKWASAKSRHDAPSEPSAVAVVNEILQEAWERAEQRQLSAALAAPQRSGTAERPKLQAAFCIDVRSEVFRRALEQLDPGIETIGFAGFFGVFVKHRRFASDVGELRLPVLLNPSVTSKSGAGAASAAADRTARFQSRALRAWGRFKQAAVSSFAFVEASGPLFAAKLVADGLSLKGRSLPNDPKPVFEPELSLDDRVKSAETVLRAMSLTERFARLVVLLGHGANVVNNPHASGLHCGACGGYSGEVNARLLASLLNDAEVRAKLVARGITIPEDTLFVAGLHDTTTDRIKLYEQDHSHDAHKADLDKARTWFGTAGGLARGERALRLPRAGKARNIPRRSRDWAEVRPEWALARCKAFIAAPRTRSSGRNLEGRAFLHDYDWKKDQARDFAVLELIMTAPVVVASWISLQYYGSTVAPNLYGSGNKLLHNVVGGVGVLEGNGGPMRAGLALQSVHQGETFVHDPLRLSVAIEAPVEAMTDILSRHAGVRQLFDNNWLHLFAIDENGLLSQRYTGNLTWAPVEGAKSPDLAAA